MALTNNAKIKDIITELQDMQMINSKSEVANIIGSPVTQNDTPAQIVTKVLATKTKMANNLVSKGVSASNSESVDALATKIGNITPATMGAKKFKSGVSTSNSNGVIEVKDLGFNPSSIVANGSYGDSGYTYYFVTTITNKHFTLINGQYLIGSTSSIAQGSSGLNRSERIIEKVGENQLVTNGFYMKPVGFAVPQSITWTAYE